MGGGQPKVGEAPFIDASENVLSAKVIRPVSGVIDYGRRDDASRLENSLAASLPQSKRENPRFLLLSSLLRFFVLSCRGYVGFFSLCRRPPGPRHDYRPPPATVSSSLAHLRLRLPAIKVLNIFGARTILLPARN
jgi:hypothetical protein